MRSFVFRIIVIELCSTGGCPLKEASELTFLSIHVSFLVLLFSTFCYFTDICCNIYAFSYYNTYGTLQVVSKLFPL